MVMATNLHSEVESHYRGNSENEMVKSHTIHYNVTVNLHVSHEVIITFSKIFYKANVMYDISNINEIYITNFF